MCTIENYGHKPYRKVLNNRGARLSAVLAVRRLLGTPLLRRSTAYCAHRSFAAIFPLTRKFVRRREIFWNKKIGVDAIDFDNPRDF